MEHPSQCDRLTIKEALGLKGFFLATTIGMLSPDKGVQYSIEGYAQFVEASLTGRQRGRIVYLIAGSCHPDFVKAELGLAIKHDGGNWAALVQGTKPRWRGLYPA